MSFGSLYDGGSGGDARLVGNMPFGNPAALPAGAVSHPRLLSSSVHKSMFSSPGLSLALVTHHFCFPFPTRSWSGFGILVGVTFRSKRIWTRTEIRTWPRWLEAVEGSWILIVGARKMRTGADRGVTTWKADLETIWSKKTRARRRDTTATPLSRSRNWKRKTSICVDLVPFDSTPIPRRKSTF
ncbi:hypothetical protein BHE74_00045898 [Ensete ventricosum]|nr:hypothetical protein BHE74_00045898 [Ensete ventricosum]